jgi:ABC-2 type transport system permease protein
MRYLKLIFVFIRAAFHEESAFRANFYINLLSVVLSLLGGIGGIYIIFTNNETLNGWTMPDTLTVLGVYMLIQSLAGLFITPSLNRLGGMGADLDMGTFDYVLLRPISKQYYVSLRQWSLWQFLHIGVSIGVIVVAVSLTDIGINIPAVLLFLASILISVGLLYSILLFVNSVAFWYRGTFLSWIVGDIMQTGRYPIDIYPGKLRFVLTWIFPIGFIVSIPAEFLTQRAEPYMLFAGFLLMAAMFTIATIFFRLSLRKYSSASS